MDYDNDDIEQEAVDESSDMGDNDVRSPGVIDSASKSTTHMAGKAIADAYAPGVGGKLYEAASRTKVGQAIEKKVAKHFSFKVKMTIFGISIFCFLLFFIVFAFFIGDGTFDSGGSSNEVCSTLPAVDNICDSVTVLDEDGNVIETVSLDEYVAGVITAEVGGFNDESLNVQKVFAIAARSYALARATKNDNNCTIESSDSFQVYNSNYNDTAVSAANETSGVVLVKDGNVQVTEYDAFCFDSRDDNYYTMCQGDPLKIPTSWVNSNVNGAVCTDSTCTTFIDYKENDGKLSHHGRGMSQYGAYYLSISENKNYKEILEYFYGKNGITLASLGEENTTCTGTGTNPSGCYNGLDNYPLRGGSATELEEQLDTVLSESQITSINNGIIASIEDAGYGTGEAVAAAATALIMGLYDTGYYLPYYFGGGHGNYTGDPDNELTIGINPKFGKTTSSTGEKVFRNKLSLDCSGFVNWAIRNAVKSDYYGGASGNFINYGKETTFSEVTPGDVFTDSGHIILVIKNNGNGTVITAESTGKGVIFNQVTSSDVSRYYIRDMDDYYASIKDSTDPYGGTGGTCDNSSSGDTPSSNNKYVLINPSHQIQNTTSSSNSDYSNEKLSMYVLANKLEGELENRGYTVFVTPSSGSIDSGDGCWDSSDGSGTSGKWATCGEKQVKYLINKHNDKNTVYVALHSNAGSSSYGPAVYYSTLNDNSKLFADNLCSSIQNTYSIKYDAASGESLFNCLNADTISEPKYYYNNNGKGSAVLIEIGSHENSNNQKFIENNGEDLAKGIADGIDKYFD